MKENELDLANEELAKRVVEACLLRGSFKLRSGVVSDYYFDKYQICSNPKLLMDVSRAMGRLIPFDTDVIAGLEMGAIPLATTISYIKASPVVFVRKERKRYGTARIIEGAKYNERRVCIIEDVITSGGAVREAISAFRDEGVNPIMVVSAIFRGKESMSDILGVPRRSLFDDASDLKPHYEGK